MLDEQNTFNRLRRIPFDEMDQKIDKSNYKPSISPIYSLGNITVERSHYYKMDLEFCLWREKLLHDNGWTLNEFVLELEKRAIIEQVDEFNKTHQIPKEIMDRAREYFPNIRFIHAKVELE